MNELTVVLEELGSLREGTLENLYGVYVKAKPGERYVIKPGFPAFVVFTLIMAEDESQIEEIRHKDIEVIEDEVVIDEKNEFLLGYVDKEKVMGIGEARLYNCFVV